VHSPRNCAISAVAVLVAATCAGADLPDKPVKGREIFEHLVSAMGGAAEVERLQAVRYKVQLTAATPKGDVTLSGEIALTYPDKLAFSTVSEHGAVRRVVNGAKGILRLPTGIQPLPETAVKEFRGVFYRDFFFMAQHRDEYDFQSLGAETVNGVEYLKLQVRGPGEPFVLLIDPKSHLPFRAHYRTAGEGGTVDVVEEFADYRRVEGLTMYFKTERFVAGGRTTRTSWRGWRSTRASTRAPTRSNEADPTRVDGLIEVGMAAGTGRSAWRVYEYSRSIPSRVRSSSGNPAGVVLGGDGLSERRCSRSPGN